MNNLSSSPLLPLHLPPLFSPLPSSSPHHLSSSIPEPWVSLWQDTVHWIPLPSLPLPWSLPKWYASPHLPFLTPIILTITVITTLFIPLYHPHTRSYIPLALIYLYPVSASSSNQFHFFSISPRHDFHQLQNNHHHHPRSTSSTTTTTTSYLHNST